MTTALAVTAATWGVAMALSPVLQIRKMVQRRSSRDVSIAYLAVLLVGFALWVAYGAALENVAVMLPNAIAFCVGAATLLVAARYRSE
jgi:MtN3 and saliva related transmembrane protein